jgi:phosphate/sulfate permease
VAEFSRPFIFGVAVAQTIGNGIVASQHISTQVILAALVSAILWDLLTWYLGFPSSSSHALVGGILGAVVMAAGWQAIEVKGLKKILISLFSSPLHRLCFWIHPPQAYLDIKLEGHTAHQRLFQAQPITDRHYTGA